MSNTTTKEFEDVLYRHFELFQNDRNFAVAMYGALCNMQWVHQETGEVYSCSWRYAGDLIASLRHMGEDYLAFYCSGNEGHVEDSVRNFLGQAGWLPLPYEDIEEVESSLEEIKEEAVDLEDEEVWWT
jgi:hypothetical protein